MRRSVQSSQLKSDYQAEASELRLPPRQGAVTASYRSRYFGVRKEDSRVKTYLATRDATQDWLREAGTWIAALLLGAAVLVNITVIFMPLGVWLVLGGLAVFLAGWAASWAVPALGRYAAVICPQCHHQNQVRTSARWFRCSRCDSLVQPRFFQNHRGAKLVPHRPSGPLSRSGWRGKMHLVGGNKAKGPVSGK